MTPEGRLERSWLPGGVRVLTLERFQIDGLKNNVPLHLRIVRDRAFQEGVLDTHFLEHHAKP